MTVVIRDDAGRLPLRPKPVQVALYALPVLFPLKGIPAAGTHVSTEYASGWESLSSGGL
ncbi:hypothetical protein [Streptomyces wuyuanensis]|uniref:hypothetical protein n=1 Tax=Streptomyces wuyuanensis TaxID=1196353 RepID=UPI003828E6DF